MLGDQESGDFCIEPFVGWRCWRMQRGGKNTPWLSGVTYGTYEWPVKEDAHATCMVTGENHHRAEDVPVKHHACGFYGYSTYEHLQDGSFLGPVSLTRGMVIGWGKTWVHEKGWRAKYARPIAFLWWPDRRVLPPKRGPALPVGSSRASMGPEYNEVQKEVAELYNVPIFETPLEMEDYARSYVA